MLKVFTKMLCLMFAASLVWAGSAMALPLHFDVADAPASSVNVNITQSCAGGLTAGLVSGLGATTFDLDVGDTKSLAFFSLDVTGDWALGCADIDATLGFDAPSGQEATGSGSGLYYAANFFGHVEGMSLKWDNSTIPDTFVYDGYLISVDFKDLTLCGGSNTVYATVTNKGVAPVPEPATMLLFGTGLIGIAGFTRRKLKLERPKS